MGRWRGQHNGQWGQHSYSLHLALSLDEGRWANRRQASQSPLQGEWEAWETEATIYEHSISFSDFVSNFSMVRVILSSFMFTHSFLCRLWATTEFNTCDRESLPFLFDLFLMKAFVQVSCTYLLNKQIFRQHPSAYLRWHHFESVQNYASLHMTMKVPNSPVFKTLYAALTRYLQL